MFTHAIVRLPGANFHEGLTDVGQGTLGVPDLDKALEQHAAYCRALEACGLTLTVLPPDLDHPDATFVEDTAILVPGAAIFTRPGAPSREGEVTRIRPAVEAFFSRCHTIEAPGTVDGGDICECGNVVFIGLSHRTNDEGGQQLAGFLRQEGLEPRFVDIRAMDCILHLKSGLGGLDGRTVVLIPELADHEAFRDFRRIILPTEESYAANCVQIRHRVFIPAGHPAAERLLTEHGYDPLCLDMSEFQKMDGGLSCLSLRF